MKVDRVDAAAALVFIASAAVTFSWCGAMSSMPGMDMPGDWVMSMTWMRMPAQDWLDYAAMFVCMWSVMMLAMMMPAFLPMLARYRRSLPIRAGTLALPVAAGYFSVWMLLGIGLLPPGVIMAEWTMTTPAVSRAMPVAGALVVMLAGAWQFTGWKARQLSCCRHVTQCAGQPTWPAAWRHGWYLGMRCVYCCANLTAVLLVMGVMDLRAMALVTMAISAERLSRERSRVERWIGSGLILVGGKELLTVVSL